MKTESTDVDKAEANKKENKTENNPLPAEIITLTTQQFRKKLWEGRMMPTILKGSKKHNEALLAARAESAKNALAKALEINSEAAPLTIPPSTKSRNELYTQAEHYLNSNHPTFLKRSSLHRDETLSLSPEKSSKPQSPTLSPFSNAKKVALEKGVGLSEECRGVYSNEELLKRIEFLGSVNKKLKY